MPSIKAMSLFLAVQLPPKKTVKMTMSHFETHFLAFLLVPKNKRRLWNPDTKLNNIGMFLQENLDFGNLT